MDPREAAAASVGLTPIHPNSATLAAQITGWAGAHLVVVGGRQVGHQRPLSADDANAAGAGGRALVHLVPCLHAPRTLLVHVHYGACVPVAHFPRAGIYAPVMSVDRGRREKGASKKGNGEMMRTLPLGMPAATEPWIGSQLSA